MAVQTWYEYMQNLPPSKLAIFLRKKLAHNQGCPPASLMQVFTMCGKTGSCDECWWNWLASPRDDVKDEDEKQVTVHRCWDCRWGARGEHGGHPFVGCLNPRFYGAIMSPDEYCSDSESKYKLGKELAKLESATQVALENEYLTEENAEKIGQEIKRRYEVKQLKREMERRKQEEKNNETAGKCEEDQGPAPDRGEGQDSSGGD